MSDQWSNAPLEQQYVLYAAATHSTLLELPTNWQPWGPTRDWTKLAEQMPTLADAIVALSSQGYVELFYGPSGGEVGLVTVCSAPGLMETSKPGRKSSYAGTEEVSRRGEAIPALTRQ
jgi:hypothetical protein